ncbi:Eukaryotic translation initiation factor 4E type 1B [Manis javanica]|nr:Eukaryotic translation initiation factor 4E type 1B [Manis javanica]
MEYESGRRKRRQLPCGCQGERRPLRKKAQGEGPAGAKLELHPLLNRWALWFFKNDRSWAWEDSLHLVTKSDTVEDFWAMYSHIQLASKLSSSCDYALFKDGIEPMWEDSRNKRGGRWLVSLTKQQRHSELDCLWLETLLRLIVESFEEHSRGCHQHPSQGDKTAVWTRAAENQEGVLHTGRVYKERLGLSTKTVTGSQAHADTATKSNSLAKNKFVM